MLVSAHAAVGGKIIKFLSALYTINYEVLNEIIVTVKVFVFFTEEPLSALPQQNGSGTNLDITQHAQNQLMTLPTDPHQSNHSLQLVNESIPSKKVLGLSPTLYSAHSIPILQSYSCVAMTELSRD